MGLLPDTQSCGLRMRRECRERFPRHNCLAIPTCITARTWRTWCFPGLLTSGFLRSRCRGKRSRHSGCISGKRPIVFFTFLYDDVIKWKHFPRYWPFVRGIHRWPVNSPHKGQWRGALMFSLIYAWINDWVNSLWRHCNETTINRYAMDPFRTIW